MFTWQADCLQLTSAQPLADSHFACEGTGCLKPKERGWTFKGFEFLCFEAVVSCTWKAAWVDQQCQKAHPLFPSCEVLWLPVASSAHPSCRKHLHPSPCWGGSLNWPNQTDWNTWWDWCEKGEREWDISYFVGTVIIFLSFCGDSLYSKHSAKVTLLVTPCPKCSWEFPEDLLSARLTGLCILSDEWPQ